MPGTVKETKLGNPTARLRLKPGRLFYWNTISVARAGVANHLGYQRWPGDTSGRWVLRRRRDSRYSIEPLGIADDDRSKPADGVSVYSYDQARSKATELANDAAQSHAKLTVAKACSNYLDFVTSQGRPTVTAESIIVCHILPSLAHHEVASLTADQLRRWLSSVAESGTRNGRDPAAPDSEESRRRRRATANRILTTLKAILNHSFDENRVSDNRAWSRRLKKYGNTASNRGRAMSVVEAKKFLKACDPELRLMVRAALETGCRYGELCRLTVSDFEAASGTLLVRRSKSGKERRVVLTAQGKTFFKAVCNTRAGSEVMLTRNGKAWGPSYQADPVEAACARSGIDIVFHDLRHCWASLSVMAGMPLTVVAKNLGHSSTAMVEKVYGHLTPSYVATAVRRHAPRFG
jgi:integrase